MALRVAYDSPQSPFPMPHHLQGGTTPRVLVRTRGPRRGGPRVQALAASGRAGWGRGLWVTLSPLLEVCCGRTVSSGTRQSLCPPLRAWDAAGGAPWHPAGLCPGALPHTEASFQRPQRAPELLVPIPAPVRLAKIKPLHPPLRCSPSGCETRGSASSCSRESARPSLRCQGQRGISRQ